MYNKTIIEFGFCLISYSLSDMVSVLSAGDKFGLSAKVEGIILIIHDIMLNLIK